MNATKDRVKYLEALYRHFDALNTDNDPENLRNTILPGFFNSIQQMEMLSRHFSKNGYLGLLLTKVSSDILSQYCHCINPLFVQSFQCNIYWVAIYGSY